MANQELTSSQVLNPGETREWSRRSWRQRWIPEVSWLDVKIALRVLSRHPLMTVTAFFALALGIPIGLVPLVLIPALNAPPPFPEGDRLVGIEQFDIRRGDQERRIAYDFEVWRNEARSFERIAAFQKDVHNLVDEDGRVEPVSGPRITASAFTTLRVAPLLGRMLQDGDEIPGAEPVVLLEHDFWQRRFGANPQIVGRRIRLGAVTHTVIGVMPAGFKFPMRTDKLWVPLQLRGRAYEPRTGPALTVFARVRGGVSLQQARADVEAIGRRLAAAHPSTHALFKPRLPGLTPALTDLRPPPNAVFTLELVALLLLAVACGNVGTLTLARTATRTTEIAVRTALGADRGRIITQLFIEALLLSTLAAAAGLSAAQILSEVFDLELLAFPDWVHLSLTPATVALGFALAILSAVIAGVLPALRATGKNVQMRLSQGVGGDSGLRFGVGAMMLIVAEVALGVGFLSVVGTVARNAMGDPAADIHIASDQYLTAQISLSGEPPSGADVKAYWKGVSVQLAANVDEMVRRLAADPGVQSVALGSALPGTAHFVRALDVDGLERADASRAGELMRVAWIRPGFFQAFGQRVSMGRDFDDADVALVRTAVIVNRSFVEQMLRGQNAIGRRIRYVNDRGEAVGQSYEIVGVVDDLGMNVANRERGAGVYHAAGAEQLNPIRVAVRVAGDPASFGPRLRAVVAAVNPELTVSELMPLDKTIASTLWEGRLTAYAFAALAFAALALSVAGLYALMSFTVSSRTYEIAVRTALGARRRHVVTIVLGRVLGQLAVGVMLGGAFGAVLASSFTTSATTANRSMAVIGTVAAVMTTVGLLACVMPTVRALRIEPIQALKQSA